MITCNKPTAHYASVLDLLNAYDYNSDGIVSKEEAKSAVDDWKLKKILTKEEAEYIINVYLNDGATNTACPDSEVPWSTIGLGLAFIAGVTYYIQKKRR